MRIVEIWARRELSPCWGGPEFSAEAEAAEAEAAVQSAAQMWHEPSIRSPGRGSQAELLSRGDVLLGTER